MHIYPCCGSILLFINNFVRYYVNVYEDILCEQNELGFLHLTTFELVIVK